MAMSCIRLSLRLQGEPRMTLTRQARGDTHPCLGSAVLFMLSKFAKSMSPNAIAFVSS